MTRIRTLFLLSLRAAVTASRTSPTLATLFPATSRITSPSLKPRSAAALELWRPHLAGSVVAIGNAPTALFYLLDMLAAGAPLRRIGEPDEIAGAAVFLASKAGSFTTGQTIVCDGGATI